MARVIYRIASGRMVVNARSTLHDTRSIWPALSGTIVVDPEAPGEGAEAEVSVDMRQFDAGDRLRNWKLRSDLDPEHHPTATFRLARLDVTSAAPLKARAAGRLAWRGRDGELQASGEGTLSASEVTATASFDLDVRSLGVEPPKGFFLKVESVVRVEVTLSALAAAS